MDRASNFVIWKARILAVLDRHRIKGFALRTLFILADPDDNEKYEDAMARAKCIILDRFKDQVVPHIAEKNTTKEIWDTLMTLCEGTSVQLKMLLENQLRSYQMHKGEHIDIFLIRLQEILTNLLP